MTDGIGPGVGHYESKRESSDECSRALFEAATANPGHSSNWTLRSALELLLRKKYSDKEAKEMIQRDIRDRTLLMKAARTGIVEVWKIVVEAVKAAGQDLPKEAMKAIARTYTNMEAYSDRKRLTGVDTVLTAAVDSKEPRMVKEVLGCLQDTLSSEEAKQMIQRDVRHRELHMKAAFVGVVDVWKIVVEAIRTAGQDLLKEALTMTKSRQYVITDSYGDDEIMTGVDTVLSVAVGSKKPRMVNEMLECLQDTLSRKEMNETIKSDVRHAGLLAQAAGTGSIEVWNIVVEAVSAVGQDLLTEALWKISWRRYTVLTAAIHWADPVMVAEVLENLQAKGVIEGVVQDKSLLARAAGAGSIEVWEMVVDAVNAVRQDLLEKALKSRQGRTMLTGAVKSKYPAMVAQVLECVHDTLSDEEAKEIVKTEVQYPGLLATAARTGIIEVWDVVVEEVKELGLLKEGLGVTKWPDVTVLVAAVESKHPAMVAEVIECVHDTLSDEEAIEMVKKHVREPMLLVTAARTGNIEVWKIVVKEFKGRGLLKEALLMKSWHGDTVLTAAVESKDPAMVAKVLECVHDTVSDEEAKEMVAKHVRDARLLDTAAGMHNIKTWEIVVKEFKWRGLLKEALLTKSRDGHTVLTAAVESKDAAMVAKVLECVHDTLSDEEAKSLLLSGSVRGATLPQCLARRRGAEIWVILLDAWKKYGALDEVHGTKRTHLMLGRYDSSLSNLVCYVVLGLRIGPPPPNGAVGQHPERMVVSVREEGKKKKKGRGFVRAGRRDGVGRGKEVMKNFGTRRARGPVGDERNMSVRSLVYRNRKAEKWRYYTLCTQRRRRPTRKVRREEIAPHARSRCENRGKDGVRREQKKNGDVDVCVVERSFCISQVLTNARRGG
ncbi:unnamed protein product [Ectocarpus sp. 6 AP-2014]